MSVYNGERFLHEAITSIHQQTWTDFEFIVIDDASTDGSPAIIGDWARCDPRIVVVRNDSNMGLTRSLNKGIRLARGRWIARMDADDLSLPERLDKQVNFLVDNPTIGLLGSAASFIGDDGFSDNDVFVNPTTHTEISWVAILNNPFFHSSVVYDRHAAYHNPYDESLRFGQDFELWGRLLKVTRAANLEEPLVKLRRHKNRVSVLYNGQQADVGLQVATQRWLDIFPGAHLNPEIINEMRQITRTAWPSSYETTTAWEHVLDLFIFFSRQNHHDPQMVAKIRRQLVEHLLVNVFSDYKIKLSKRLFYIIAAHFSWTVIKVIVSKIYNKL